MAETYSFDYLLKDLQEVSTGVSFENTEEGKVKALEFKQYAIDNGVMVHVIKDEYQNWFVITELHYQFLDNAYKSAGLSGIVSY